MSDTNKELYQRLAALHSPQDIERVLQKLLNNRQNAHHTANTTPSPHSSHSHSNTNTKTYSSRARLSDDNYNYFSDAEIAPLSGSPPQLTSSPLLAHQYLSEYERALLQCVEPLPHHEPPVFCNLKYSNKNSSSSVRFKISFESFGQKKIPCKNILSVTRY